MSKPNIEFLTDQSREHWQLSISRFGVSDALQADFAMLRELTGAAGTNKFSQKSVDALAQIVVCRNYGNACYELAHLCWSILHVSNPSVQRHSRRYQSALLQYFWIDQVASKRQFVDYFMSQNNANECINEAIKDSQKEFVGQSYKTLALVNDNLAIHINGHDFTLNGSRANFLACLMEWLISLIPDLLNTLENALIGSGKNAIKELASRLQKEIYAYLNKHLPPAKLQRRYRHIANWYNKYIPVVASHEALNDDTIYKFWTENNKIEGFTKFTNVLSDHLAYLQAQEVILTEAQLTFANSLEWHIPPANTVPSTHETHENGETLNTLFEHYLSPETIDLALISQRPKALNQSQIELSEYLALYPNLISNFSISWLRAQVFGKYQNQLIQAKRKSQVLDLHQLHVEPNDYADTYQACVQIIANNQQALLAISNILLDQNIKESLALLAKLMRQLPSMQPYFPEFMRLLENKEHLSQADLSSWQLQHTWFTDLIKQSKLARKKINRQGFSQNTLLSEDEYLVAANHLFALNRSLSKLLKVINKNKYQKHEKFESDRFIFINELSRLYFQEGQ